MKLRRSSRRGNTIIEFTMVGIPVLFLLISVFEMSRGMWMYHTLGSAVREGVRYAVTHGNSCNIYPNGCVVRISDIAARIRGYAIGFTPAQIENLTFTSATRTITCATLADCLTGEGAGSSYWPAGPPGAVIDIGGNKRSPLEIRADFRFESSIAMFWPGAGAGQNFAAVVLPASSREPIQY
jgi:hypothetical protein